MLIEELEYFPEDLNSVWMICNTSGRLDHLFSQIHSLYHFKKWPIYLLSQSWITFLLPQGDSLIEVNRVSIGNSIGLIPIGQPCAVWTRGLKWNLGNESSNISL